MDMRIDRRDVRRFVTVAAGLYAVTGLVALVLPGLGIPLALAVTALLATVVLLTLFLRAWHWFISEGFSLIEERAKDQYVRKPDRRRD